MKNIFIHIFSFIKEDFNWKTYSFSTFLMVLALYLNYFSALKGNFFSFEEKYSDQFGYTNSLYFFYFIFYTIPYIILLFYKLLVEKSTHLLNSSFWLKFAFIFIVLSFDGGFYIPENLLKNYSFSEQYVLSSFIYGGHSFFCSSLLICIYYFLFETEKNPFIYGFTKRNINILPYLILLAIISPFIYYASTTTDFLDQYPSLSTSFIGETHFLPKKVIIGLYEIIYLLDFINLELMMRGILVVGMTKLLGRHAILPVTIVYMMLHFERPILEAIGSVFGGYALSILALRTKSILGGCMVHIGIAALMEIFAFFQIYMMGK